MLFAVFFLSPGPKLGYGVDVFTKNEQPFGIPYDVWIGKYWNWTVSLSQNEIDKNSTGIGCIMKSSDSMVMLRTTSAEGKPNYICNIPAKSGVMISLWSGWYEKNNETTSDAPINELSNLAKWEVNLGRVTAGVKVDGKSVANIVETTSKSKGYKIESINNVTEVYAKLFNITIPEDTHQGEQVTGTWPSGAHGWFVFLKPLPPGDHKINYFVNVEDTGEKTVNPTSAELEYTIHVE